jgi:hypothetical protein
MTKTFKLGASAAVFAAVAAFAGMASAQQAAPAAPQATPAAPTAAPQPAAPGAKQPDLNGIWGGQLVEGGTSTVDSCKTVVDAFAREGGRFAYQGRTGSQQWVTFEQDCGIGHRGKMDKPIYKPEFWQSVRLHDYFANTGNEWNDWSDPDWKGIDGVPRMGPPNKIVQTATEVVFMYQTGNLFRVIPTDCRAWDPVERYDQTTMGLAVGCFLDDGTLVVKETGFSDGTWLDWNGYVHSNEMGVTETFKRNGDNLVYNVVVEDPVYFMEPWNWGSRSLALQKGVGAQLMQDVPFVDRSLGNLVDPQYRG